MPIGIQNGYIYAYAGDGTVGYTGDGSLAIDAELSGVDYITLDSAGNIYISDQSNNVIRLVNASTKIISTYVGGGAGLSGPQGVSCDPSDNLYIADFGSNVIRRVDKNTLVVSVVAGTGEQGYSGDGGPPTSARLFTPFTVAFDTAGNMYILDGQYDIRVVNTQSSTQTILGVSIPPNTIQTVVGGYNNSGNGAGYSGDGGPATAAQINNPFSMKLDTLGNLYIADSFNNVVRKVSTSGIISTIAGIGGEPGYTGDGGLATAATLNTPGDVVVDSAGNIYITDWGVNVVRMVNPSGIISTFAGTGGVGDTGDGNLAIDATFDDPLGIALDSSGNVYIADQNNAVIRQITTLTSSGILEVSPLTLEFDLVGAQTVTESITVTNAGTGTLSFTVSSDSPWLTVFPSSGTASSTAPQVVNVQVNTTELATSLSESTDLISAETNAPYPNRLQLLLGPSPLVYTGNLTVVAAGATESPQNIVVTLLLSASFLGPWVQDGPLGLFDPRRDLQVYADGKRLTVQTFTFDAINNRYLLYMSSTFNLQGLIQVLYHMPSPPFVTSLPPTGVVDYIVQEDSYLFLLEDDVYALLQEV